MFKLKGKEDVDPSAEFSNVLFKRNKLFGWVHLHLPIFQIIYLYFERVALISKLFSSSISYSELVNQFHNLQFLFIGQILQILSWGHFDQCCQ